MSIEMLFLPMKNIQHSAAVFFDYLTMLKPFVLEASSGLINKAFSKYDLASAFFPAIKLDHASMWLPS